MKSKICVRCGLIGKKNFCELDNKGSEEWVCKDCAMDLACDCNCEVCELK